MMNNKTQNLIKRINDFNDDYNSTSSGTQWTKWNSESKSIKSELENLSDSDLLIIKAKMNDYSLSIRSEFASYFTDLKPAPAPQKISLSKVMSTAWKIFKGGFAQSFSVALSRAWKIIKISLGRGTHIEYAKSTGEVRQANALQLGSLSTIDRGFIRYLEDINGSTQWRSFKITHLIAA